MRDMKLLQVRRIEQGRLKGATLEYFRTETKAEPAQYGAAIRLYADGKVEEATIDDISADIFRIEALVLALADGTVTPCTMRDIVEDWLNSV